MVFQDGKLLFLRGKGYPELWTPGGKCEGGESDLECLRRELMEELGVVIKDASFFKEYPGFSFYNPEQSLVQRVYIVSIEGKPKPSAEIESFVWLSKEDVASGKYPVITDIREKFIPDLIESGIW